MSATAPSEASAEGVEEAAIAAVVPEVSGVADARVTPGPTLGADLRERRLAHRRGRLQLAVHALEVRARASAEAGQAAPAPLLAAIAGFEQELAEVTAELGTLRGPAALDRWDGPRAAA